MNLLSVDNISKYIGERKLFGNVSFGIDQGEKLALVARNGAGKSTLLKILFGLDVPEEGMVTWRKDIIVAFQKQREAFAKDITVKESFYVSDIPAFQVLDRYNKSLESGESPSDEIYSELEQVRAWDAEVLMITLLDKLGLGELNDAKVEHLSGGQVKRLSLAHALVAEPDFLILDEPTNHLDLDMIEWLEKYLKQSSSSLLLVSHDRYFIDNVCSGIIELQKEGSITYKGDYGYFLEKKAMREEQKMAEVDKFKNIFRRELEWVRRTPSARGTKSKSRLDRFVDIKENAHQKLGEDQVEFGLLSERLGTKIIETHKLKFSYPNKNILNGLDYIFKRRERIGIVGENGTGKTTLLNLLAKKIEGTGGKVTHGDTVHLGYYTQKGMNLDKDKKVIDAVRDVAEYIQLKKGKTLTAGQLCERFLFDSKQQYQWISTLSGGEQKRLYLLTVLMRNPNVLFLDEPTNDLDIDTMNLLEAFISEIDGAVVVVSHDRYFLDKIVDHIFYLDGSGEVKDFPGDYTQFREWKREFAKNKPKEVAEEVEVKAEEVAVKKENKQKMSFKEKREFEELGELIPKLGEKQTELTDALQSGDLDTDQLIKTAADLESLISELEDKEMRWLELSELEA
jgi:ATP-binding cassette subfamily F protein uup